MALLFFDSFGLNYSAYEKWQRSGFQATDASFYTTNNGERSGLSHIELGQNGNYGTSYTKALPAVGGFVFGSAVMAQWKGYDNGTTDLLQAREDVYPSQVTHLTLGTNALSQLVVKVGSTVVATGTRKFKEHTWDHFQFKGVIDSAAGSYSVRVNDIAVPELTASGVNTRNGGTGQWNRLAIQGNGEIHFDDIYACDFSGTSHNDFLGMVKADVLRAVTDAVAPGTTRTLTPSTGSDHGALVDEQFFASGTSADHNTSATVGAKDTYRLTALPFSSLHQPITSIRAVQTNLLAWRSELHSRLVRHVVRTGSPAADYGGPNVNLSNQFENSFRVWPVNPATGLAWTVADINAIEMGLEITG